MKIIEAYSFNGGEKFIRSTHPAEYQDVVNAIDRTDAIKCLRKVSEEKTMPDHLLFAPAVINEEFKTFLHPLGWTESADGKKKKFKEPRIGFGNNRFREMDGIKNKVGLEIQFGKYAFMGYDIFSKMIIFHKRGLIDCGIEIVAYSSLAHEMSTGVSEFEQILIDFKERGVSNIDIPVLVLGIGLTDREEKAKKEKQRRFLENPQALYVAREVDRPRRKTKPGPK